MPSRLFIEEITSVGGVDAGDNPEAVVTFWKRHPQQQEMFKDSPTGDSAASANATERTDMPFDFNRIEDEGLRSEVEAHVSELTQRLEAAEAPADEPEDDVAKDLPDEVKTLIEKRDSEIETLRKRVDEEVAKRRAAEFVEKAKPLTYLLGKPEEVGPVLEEIERNAPEAYAKIAPSLEAAAQRVEMSGLFNETGESGDGESDPIAKRDAWVKDYLKEHPDATDAQARAAFWKAHPADKAASRES